MSEISDARAILHHHGYNVPGQDARSMRGLRSGSPVIAHAKRGTRRYEYTTFQANDDPALKLAIYTPVGADGV